MKYPRIAAKSAKNNSIENKSIMYRFSISAVTLLLALLNVNAYAQTDALNKCKAIQDAEKRLACYDALQEQTQAQQAQKVETLKQSVADTSTKADDELDDIERRARALMSTSKTGDKPFSSNTARISSGGPDLSKRQNNAEMDEFGRAASADDNSKIEGDELYSSVTGVKRDSRDYATFTLSNGQIWRQTEGSQLRIRTGDEITIEKGVLSSYYLSKPGNNRQVRVTRVK